MLDIPVVGLSEATFHSAMFWDNASIICPTSRHRAWYGESGGRGSRDRIVNLRALPVAVRNISTVVEDLADRFANNANGRIGKTERKSLSPAAEQPRDIPEDIEPSTRAIA